MSSRGRGRGARKGTCKLDIFNLFVCILWTLLTIRMTKYIGSDKTGCKAVAEGWEDTLRKRKEFWIGF